jgi:hypothetical protein
VLDSFPVEKDIWEKRAKEKDEIFNNYKTMNLIKFIKAIVKNPALIKENILQFKKSSKMLLRIKSMRNSMLKMAILKLILRQYYLKKCLNLTLKLKKKQVHKDSIDISTAHSPPIEPVPKNKVAPIQAKSKFHEFVEN